METFSALLAISARNSPASGEFPTQRPVTRSCDVFFDLCLNKRFSREAGDLRRYRAHYDVTVMHNIQSYEQLKMISNQIFFTKSMLCCVNYINPGYGLSLVDTLWNASSYRQPLEQEGNPMT